jgi:hypothetical protein
MSYTYLCENFICSPGQAAESLAECSSATPQFALWKLNHTAAESCSKDSATESCHDSQFGTTSPHFPQPLGADGLTSCAEGSLAKTFPQPEKAQASTAHVADCGGTWPEWFAKFDRVSSSWKTRQCSLLAGLDAFSGTWPRWGMMRGGVCWELTTPGHRTGENESGFWPTPCLPGNGGSHGKRKLKARLWPTPQASDNRDRGNLGMPAILRRQKKGKQIGLGQSVSDTSGALSPDWVEWLMGWPIGWTDLKPLAMDRCHSVLLSHGAPSQDSNP